MVAMGPTWQVSDGRDAMAATRWPRRDGRDAMAAWLLGVVSVGRVASDKERCGLSKVRLLFAVVLGICFHLLVMTITRSTLVGNAPFTKKKGSRTNALATYSLVWA